MLPSHSPAVVGAMIVLVVWSFFARRNAATRTPA